MKMKLPEAFWLEVVKLVRYLLVIVLLYWLFKEPLMATLDNASSFQIFGLEYKSKEVRQAEDAKQVQLREMEKQIDAEIRQLNTQLEELEKTKERLRKQFQPPPEQPRDTGNPSWLSNKPQVKRSSVSEKYLKE